MSTKFRSYKYDQISESGFEPYPDNFLLILMLSQENYKLEFVFL